MTVSPHLSPLVLNIQKKRFIWHLTPVLHLLLPRFTCFYYFIRGKTLKPHITKPTITQDIIETVNQGNNALLLKYYMYWEARDRQEHRSENILFVCILTPFDNHSFIMEIGWGCILFISRLSFVEGDIIFTSTFMSRKRYVHLWW